MTKTKFEIAKEMNLLVFRIYTGIRSCPRPIEHEGETHYGTHKFMKEPVWVHIEKCRECDYFLAESTTGTRKIICCFERD